MQGFRGLIPKQLCTEEAMAPLLKKTEEYRKIQQHTTDIIISLGRIFETHLVQTVRICSMLKQGDIRSNCSYYQNLEVTYIEVNNMFKDFTEKEILTPVNDLTLFLSTRFVNFSGCVINFQQLLKNYTATEATTSEMVRKYFKNQKSLLNGIQSYKDSFHEAKLVYNMQEKNKRYSFCSQSYRTITQQHETIQQIREKLEEKKKDIIRTYESIEEQLQANQNVLNAKFFGFMNDFIREFCHSMKERAEFLRNKKISLEKENCSQIFIQELNHIIPSSNEEEEEKDKIQSFFSFFEKLQISAESQGTTSEQLQKVIKKMDYFYERIKGQHKRVYDFHLEFYKSFEKIFVPHLKEAFNHIDKTMKKSKQLLVKQNYEMLKKVNQALKVIISNYDSLLKRILPKIQKSHNTIEQFNQTLKLAFSEIQSHLQKVMDFKSSKKQFNEELKGKILFLTHLITGFDEKLSKNINYLKRIYNDLINDFSVGFSEMESSCSDFVISDNEAKTHILEIKRSNFERLKGINFSELKKEELRNKVSFDGETLKNEDFTKLKPPTEIDVMSKKKEERGSPRQSKNEEMEETQEKNVPKNNDNQSGVQPGLKKDKKKKAKIFLSTKINFLQNEEVIGTFSCALADKIILQGKLYITSNRICFFSKFNSDTVFFKETFIQIPLKDIIQLEKRKNGIFFDNSISLTTKNGEIFLTSFIKRNTAFDLISEVSGLNKEEQAYLVESEEEEGSSNSQNGNQMKFEDEVIEEQKGEREDDIKEEEIPERGKQIDEMTKSDFPYKDIHDWSISDQNVTAFKILTTIILPYEMTYNKKKSPSFNECFKKNVLLHKDIQMGPFDPEISQYLNPTNIKSNCPLKFTRTLSSTIPVANSGIPFMPKWAKTFETQNLYIVSKHRWIAQSCFENSGAPYTDCFRVYFTTVCESNNKQCNVFVKIHVNFIKSTMMKGIIESKSHEESKMQLKKQFDQYKKWLTEVDKKKAKKLNQGKMEQSQSIQQLKNAQEASTQQEAKIAELQQKVEELKKQNEEKQESNQKIISKLKGGLIGLVILYILTVILGVIFLRQ